MKRALLAVVLMLCVACERTPTQIGSVGSLLVHSLLLTGEDSVRVFVSRFDSVGTSADEVPIVPVVNARVRIVHGTDTTVLATQMRCSNLIMGCYAGVIPGGVRSGETYQLLVDADLERARGEAVVPALPAMHSPDPGITLQYSPTRQPEAASSVLVRWSGVDPGMRVDLTLLPNRRECYASMMRTADRLPLPRFALIGRDTVTITVSDVQCPDTTQSVFPAELLLTAYDATYTAYLRQQSPTSRPEDAAAGLTEGLGVFAAAASVSVPVTLVRH